MLQPLSRQDIFHLRSVWTTVMQLLHPAGSHCRCYSTHRLQWQLLISQCMTVCS